MRSNARCAACGKDLGEAIALSPFVWCDECQPRRPKGLDTTDLNTLLKQMRDRLGDEEIPVRVGTVRWPTFWHTPIGRLLTWSGIVKRIPICGRTCGCGKATGCLGKPDGV